MLDQLWRTLDQIFYRPSCPKCGTGLSGYSWYEFGHEHDPLPSGHYHKCPLCWELVRYKYDEFLEEDKMIIDGDDLSKMSKKEIEEHVGIKPEDDQETREVKGLLGYLRDRRVTTRRHHLENYIREEIREGKTKHNDFAGVEQVVKIMLDTLYDELYDRDVSFMSRQDFLQKLSDIMRTQIEKSKWSY